MKKILKSISGAFGKGALFGTGLIISLGVVFAIVVHVDDIPVKGSGDDVTPDEFNSIVKTIKGLYNADRGTETSADNNIGLGTQTPQSKFHLHEPSTAEVGLLITNQNTGGSSTDGGKIAITSDTLALSNLEENGAIDFNTTDDSGTTDTRMRITGLGDVGIGTTTPSTGGERDLKVDVEGATGAQYYCDQDGNNCFALNSGIVSLFNLTCDQDQIAQWVNGTWACGDVEAAAAAPASEPESSCTTTQSTSELWGGYVSTLSFSGNDVVANHGPDASAWVTTPFSGDVTVEWTAGQIDHETTWGFITQANLDNNWGGVSGSGSPSPGGTNTQGYSVYYNDGAGSPNGRIYRYGTVLLNGLQKPSAGQKLTLRRTGTTIEYLIDDSSIYTWSDPLSGDIYFSTTVGNTPSKHDMIDLSWTDGTCDAQPAVSCDPSLDQWSGNTSILTWNDPNLSVATRTSEGGVWLTDALSGDFDISFQGVSDPTAAPSGGFRWGVFLTTPRNATNALYQDGVLVDYFLNNDQYPGTRYGVYDQNGSTPVGGLPSGLIQTSSIVDRVQGVRRTGSTLELIHNGSVVYTKNGISGNVWFGFDTGNPSGRNFVIDNWSNSTCGN